MIWAPERSELLEYEKREGSDEVGSRVGWAKGSRGLGNDAVDGQAVNGNYDG